MSGAAITFDNDYSIDILWAFNWFHKLYEKSKSQTIKEFVVEVHWQLEVSAAFTDFRY